LAGLEEDLVRHNGCRDALVVWRQEGGHAVLLDGHNRYEICQRRNLPFDTTLVNLPSRKHAMMWICDNQLNRRNLNEGQRALVGAQLATMRQGARTDLSPIGGMSQRQAAQAVNVGTRSIQRGKVILQNGSPKLIDAVMRGVIPPSVGEAVTRLAPEEQDRIAEDCVERGDARRARQAAKARRQAEKQSKAIGTATPAMDGPQRFAVVLADPWRIEGGQVSGDPQIADRYPDLPPDKIKSARRELAVQVQPDAVLFLRAPAPRFNKALKMMQMWGFEPVAHIVCLNPGAGCDNHVTYEHDLLFIGTRGNGLLTNPADRSTSVTNTEPREIIAEIYPKTPWLELFARAEWPGSNSCGRDALEAITPDDSVDLD
jgi:ParB-like chromosome segregation protein Spo0J